MPRGPRLDGPNALHHVIVRGIEGRLLFLGDADRQDFLDRLASVVTETGLSVLAWSLLPNHAHLLVRTGARPLATAMASLLTGYAGSFNRRHHRAGRLFQNRYKSILVEEEPYLLELVRYIHLNLFRAGLVRTVEDLDRFPWSGHSVLVGRQGSSHPQGSPDSRGFRTPCGATRGDSGQPGPRSPPAPARCGAPGAGTVARRYRGRVSLRQASGRGWRAWQGAG